MQDRPHTVPLPKVTIAIPTLNRVGYLRLSLESALTQTYPNIEVIVSNNASTDETGTYLSASTHPRLRVLHHSTLLSMTDNWNACLHAATGEYFLLLSDDDILEPNAIHELIAGYTEHDGHTAPGLVYGGGNTIDFAGEIKRPFRQSPPCESPRSLILAFFQGKRDLRFCAVLLRTADLQPGFPSTYKVACDAAIWMQVTLRHGPAIFIPKPLARYREHENLSTATQLDVWRAEYHQLHQLAIAEDLRAGRPDPAFAGQIDSVMRQIDRDMIAGRINQTLGGNKAQALIEYGRRLPAFLSPLGLLNLAKGLVALFMSQQTKLWLREKLRKQPASLP